MRITAMRTIASLAMLAVAISGCAPAPQKEEKSAVLTLSAFCDQLPYEVYWKIEGGEGLNGEGKEPVATHEYSRKLRYGQKPLTITFRLTGKRRAGATGSVSVIDEKGKEVMHEPLDAYLGIAQLVYITVPPK